MKQKGKKKKRMKRNEDNVRDLWDNVKHPNIRITGVPEEEYKKKGHEKIFEEIIVENFPQMGKETATQVQETQRVPNRVNSRQNTPVQFSSVSQSFPTLCDHTNHSTPGLPVRYQLPEFTQTHVHESVMLSNHLILCPLLLPPLIFPSIRVFSNESVLCIRWPKYWNFSLSISPSNEYSGLISFRMDWLDLLTVQGTLKNLLQHRSSKVSVHCSPFIIFQLSHQYTTTGKTIALTRWTFVGKVMSLLFNMLSRLVIIFSFQRVSVF